MTAARNILLCFWVMWSATTVSKNDQGGLTFTGGIWVGPAADYLDITKRQSKPGDVIWHRAGLFFDTLSACQLEAKNQKNQQLVCLPKGIVPLSSKVFIRSGMP